MADYPVLIGDIGGTNARFAVLTGPGVAPVLLPRQLVARHPSPVPAALASLGAWTGPAPRRAILAVATRVDGPAVRLTNADWLIDAAAFGRALGLSGVLLVNDYAPVAVALDAPDLGREGGVVPLGPLRPEDARGTKLVLGPGTGFGAAALIDAGERLVVQTTEAGHVEFGPAAPDEEALWPLLERVGGRITAETVLSGPGLHRLYLALCQARGDASACAVPNDVIEACLAGGDARARQAVGLFARLLGRFAGDLALIFGASGGVLIGSGVAPRILPWLQDGAFRAAFERKAPFEDWIRGIPTAVLSQPEPALIGLSHLAAHPERFVVGAGGWREG